MKSAGSRLGRRRLPGVVLITGLCWVLCSHGVGAETDEAAQRERIATLRAEIAYHDQRYFQEAAPEITDYEYDQLKRELRRLEAAAGEVSDEVVGSDLDRDDASGARIAHGAPMLSLDKAYEDAEVARFFARVAAASPDEPVRFAIEPKFDGVAVNVVLRRGRLVRASTRGDGERGEEVTAQLRVVRGLDYEWAFDARAPRIEEIELRGEVYQSQAAFAQLNAERVAAGLEPFRHPRSVAAGSIKLDDLEDLATRRLSLVFHGWGAVKPAEAAPQSVMEFQRWLEGVGLPAVADAHFATPDSAAELNALVARRREETWPYPTDGLVLKVDDVSLQQVLGNGPTAPRWALARKFTPPRAETVLRRIVWQVGRTGGLTPVAEFDPVVLGGATIQRASLHNAAEIVRRDLRLGDTVWIEKAGQIIPQVAGVEVAKRPAGAMPFRAPQWCPSCAKPLRNNKSNTLLQCEYWPCPDQLEQRLLHFASRSALRIRGLGPGMAEKLVESGLVRATPDLYELKEAQLVGLPGVGPRTAESLVAAIAESRHASLVQVLVGLGLPGMGPARAQERAGEISSLEELVDEPAEVAALPHPEMKEVIVRLNAVFAAR